MGKFSFLKTDRILKRSDFIRLSKSNTKVHTDCFIVAVLKGDCDNVRIGITVTKRVGNAVQRNRIKRLVREYFRLNKQNIMRDLDINIIVKKKVALLSSKQVFKSLGIVFERINGKRL